MALFKLFGNYLKKIFLVLGVFYIIIVVFSFQFNKNKPQDNSQAYIQAQQKQLYSVLKDPRFSESKKDQLILGAYRAIHCAFIGELCTDTPQAGNEHFKKSIIGTATQLLTVPYTNPPASGTYWIAESLKNSGLLPSAYAAEGIGFASIKPLMNLWKIFRDIAYLLIVLVLVAIGFMIIFRMKINPQTVISVENALPKIVITLLLITFSFPIAGLLIDAMYLLIVLIVGILSSNNTYYNVAEYQNIFLQANFGTLWEHAIPLPESVKNLFGFPQISYVGDALAALLPESINTVIRGLVIGVGVLFIGNTIYQIMAGGGFFKWLNGIIVAAFSTGTITEPIFGGISFLLIIYVLTQLLIHGIGFIIGIIVDLAIFGMIWNIFFMLIRSYIQITLSIVLSPIILLFEALPGKSTFTFWLKGIFAELITFPVVITLLLIQRVLFMTLTYPGDFWSPPFLFELNPGTFGVIFGMGLLLITPDIVKFVKEGIGAKPLPFNIGLNTFFSGGGAVVGGGMGILQQFSTLNLGLQGLSAVTSRFAPKQSDEFTKTLKNKAAGLKTGDADPK